MSGSQEADSDRISDGRSKSPGFLDEHPHWIFGVQAWGHAATTTGFGAPVGPKRGRNRPIPAGGVRSGAVSDFHPVRFSDDSDHYVILPEQAVGKAWRERVSGGNLLPRYYRAC